MVVDDSTLARKMVVSALTQLGITEVDEAKDGVEAVEMVNQADYGLILVDWNMPRMLGIDAVKQIRNMGKTMPIIMVTSLSDVHHVKEAVQAGVNNYLIKPFRPEEAVKKIKETIPALEVKG